MLTLVMAAPFVLDSIIPRDRSRQGFMVRFRRVFLLSDTWRELTGSRGVGPSAPDFFRGGTYVRNRRCGEADRHGERHREGQRAARARGAGFAAAGAQGILG